MSFIAPIFSLSRNPVIKAMHTFSPFLLLPLLASFAYTLFVLVSHSFLSMALPSLLAMFSQLLVLSDLDSSRCLLLYSPSYLNRIYLNEVKYKIKPFLLNIPWSSFAFNLHNFIMSHCNL